MWFALLESTSGTTPNSDWIMWVLIGVIVVAFIA